MRILLLALLGLLISCSGAPSTSNTNNNVPPANVANATNANASGTDMMHGMPAAEWNALSGLERSEVIAEEEMLADLAAKGIYPELVPCQITVKDHRSGVTIGLYNEAYVDQSTYYKESRPSASYKVIPNIKMGALLKSLDDQGYFEEAASGSVKMRGAFLSVFVRRGNEKWTLNWGQVLGDENKELTYSCSDSVRVVFDTQLSIQVVDNPDASDFFEKERNRINRDNAQRMSNRDH
ncbi:MAG: hypothetical protein GY747_12730 [Planctomycetes bacterium]|nr:hypothetical protein [Planctomycetota bacterium]MCP4770544.1 hypothetical protein [Planctomycetota bacterium]MCP4860365.1 hypothetical protein [Planctomycetota bacterium]